MHLLLYEGYRAPRALGCPVNSKDEAQARCAQAGNQKHRSVYVFDHVAGKRKKAAHVGQPNPKQPGDWFGSPL